MKPETIAAFTTAGGTLVLAVSTFAATRSANRSSRLAEQTLLAGMRPVLVPAQLHDPRQKVSFVDQHWVMIEGTNAAAEEIDGVIYLVLPVRNAGSGVAVLQGWHPVDDPLEIARHQPLDEFRMHMRDMFIPSSGLGFWQASVRDREDPARLPLSRAIAEHERFAVDILYSDLHGHQQAISRFSFTPAHDRWLSTMSRHWTVDGVAHR